MRIAVQVARSAGALVAERRGQARTSVSTKSSPTDMVSEVDRASEALVLRLLSELRPDDAVLGEEGTEVTGTSGVRWVVDPLDGTTNFLYDFPSFGVSVAAEVDGVAVAGAVCDPVHGEVFSAARGLGAWRGDQPLTVAAPVPLAKALVGTGFSYRAAKRIEQAATLGRVLPKVRDIRRAGAAALDLCWLAAGRVDAYYEWGLGRWDWAAGLLIATEAGRRSVWLDDGTLVATSPEMLDELVALVQVPG